MTSGEATGCFGQADTNLHSSGFERMKSVTVLMDDKLINISFIRSRPKCSCALPAVGKAV